uniref:Uncharacterized protein n=1 Tax=Leersia perrieri TaxID=77586 RepID=A0A0D9VMQ9_9ORYZ
MLHQQTLDYSSPVRPAQSETRNLQKCRCRERRGGKSHGVSEIQNSEPDVGAGPDARQALQRMLVVLHLSLKAALQTQLLLLLLACLAVPGIMQ